VEKLGLQCTTTDRFILFNLLNSSNNAMERKIKGTLGAVGTTGVESHSMTLDIQDGTSRRASRSSGSRLHVEGVKVLRSIKSA
jgi:hypothetical protein